jgi:hypothetical protein
MENKYEAQAREMIFLMNGGQDISNDTTLSVVIKAIGRLGATVERRNGVSYSVSMLIRMLFMTIMCIGMDITSVVQDDQLEMMHKHIALKPIKDLGEVTSIQGALTIDFSLSIIIIVGLGAWNFNQFDMGEMLLDMNHTVIPTRCNTSISVFLQNLGVIVLANSPILRCMGMIKQETMQQMMNNNFMQNEMYIFELVCAYLSKESKISTANVNALPEMANHGIMNQQIKKEEFNLIQTLEKEIKTWALTRRINSLSKVKVWISGALAPQILYSLRGERLCEDSIARHMGSILITFRYSEYQVVVDPVRQMLECVKNAVLERKREIFVNKQRAIPKNQGMSFIVYDSDRKCRGDWMCQCGSNYATIAEKLLGRPTYSRHSSGYTNQMLASRISHEWAIKSLQYRLRHINCRTEVSDYFGNDIVSDLKGHWWRTEAFDLVDLRYASLTNTSCWKDLVITQFNSIIDNFEDENPNGIAMAEVAFEIYIYATVNRATFATVCEAVLCILSNQTMLTTHLEEILMPRQALLVTSVSEIGSGSDARSSLTGIPAIEAGTWAEISNQIATLANQRRMSVDRILLENSARYRTMHAILEAAEIHADALTRRKWNDYAHTVRENFENLLCNVSKLMDITEKVTGTMRIIGIDPVVPSAIEESQHQTTQRVNSVMVLIRILASLIWKDI